MSEGREEEEDTQAWWGLLKLLIMCHTNENKEVIPSRAKEGAKQKDMPTEQAKDNK